MKTLIIGGSRFVGLHLIDELTARGHAVTVMNRGNANEALPPQVEVLIGDRRDEEQVNDVLRDRDFDFVFDIVGYEPGDAEPFIDNLRGRIRNYVFVSTGSVYAPPHRVPLFENSPRVTDASHGEYGWKKRLLEDELLAAYEQYDFPVTIIRPGYIYGPHNYAYRERFFFDRILLDRPILIPGDGNMLTQFGHVDDLAVMQAQVLDAPEAIGRAYNFVGRYAYTLNAYVELVGKVVGRQPRLVHFDPGELDLSARDVARVFPYNWRAHKVRSVERAARDLGYRERYSLEEGLVSAFAQYQRDAWQQSEPDTSHEDQVLCQLGRG